MGQTDENKIVPIEFQPICGGGFDAFPASDKFQTQPPAIICFFYCYFLFWASRIANKIRRQRFCLKLSRKFLDEIQTLLLGLIICFDLFNRLCKNHKESSKPSIGATVTCKVIQVTQKQARCTIHAFNGKSTS